MMRIVRLSRSAISLSRTPKLTRVRAAFHPCSTVVRPTYDTSACASTVGDTRNAVFVRTLQPKVLADRSRVEIAGVALLVSTRCRQ